METYRFTISNFFKHLKRVIRHKHYVFKWCCKAGMPLRGLLHDMSKFSPVEFIESVKYFSEKESPINVCKRVNGVSLAWMHHKGRNPHHYEHWVDRLDDGCIPVKMPRKYAYEMICDYLGAGQAYNPDGWSFQNEYDWWVKRMNDCPNMSMNSETKDFVTHVFSMLKDGHIFNRDLLDTCWGYNRKIA